MKIHNFLSVLDKRNIFSPDILSQDYPCKCMNFLVLVASVILFGILGSCLFNTLLKLGKSSLACPPGNIFTILLQVTKSEATSCKSLRYLYWKFSMFKFAKDNNSKNAKAIIKIKLFLIFTRLSTHHRLSDVHFWSF